MVGRAEVNADRKRKVGIGWARFDCPNHSAERYVHPGDDDQQQQKNAEQATPKHTVEVNMLLKG